MIALFAIVLPLLGGFHPDPTVCRGRDGAYYLATSSFAWAPGVPIYRSEDFTNWTFVAHAVSEAQFRQMRTRPLLNDDQGVWAPTLRYARGRYWLVYTFHNGDSVNYVQTAERIEGPWSDPRRVACCDTDGIDPSLFFDDDGKVWWQANRGMQAGERKWRAQMTCYLQEFDPAGLRLIGPRHDITTGVFDRAKYAEGPHLHKVGDTYVYMLAEGGCGRDHAETMLTAECVTGPWRAAERNPILTRRGGKKPDGLACAGHADVVRRSGDDYWAVFLGVRDIKGTLLARETFACAARWDGRQFVFDDDHLIAGRVLNDEPWSKMMTEGDEVWVRNIRDNRFDVTFEVPADGEAVIYRNREACEAWSNPTGKAATFRLASQDGAKVSAWCNGARRGEAREMSGFVRLSRHSKFNGPGYGWRIPAKGSHGK